MLFRIKNGMLILYNGNISLHFLCKKLIQKISEASHSYYRSLYICLNEFSLVELKNSKIYGIRLSVIKVIDKILAM